MELTPLATEEARDGWFLHESIATAIPPNLRRVSLRRAAGRAGRCRGADRRAHLQHGAAAQPPLRPERTPLLDRVRFRNHVLQQVIQLLSLSRAGGRGKRRGRISYAQLGINQLGAVYEGLLSYSGFFAQRADSTR